MEAVASRRFSRLASMLVDPTSLPISGNLSTVDGAARGAASVWMRRASRAGQLGPRLLKQVDAGTWRAW